jgi:hypothetical protein
MELREVLRGEIEKIGIAPHLSARKPGSRTVVEKSFCERGAKLSNEDLLRELFAPAVAAWLGPRGKVLTDNTQQSIRDSEPRRHPFASPRGGPQRDRIPVL